MKLVDIDLKKTKAVICTDPDGLSYWTKNKTYTVSQGQIVDDQMDTWGENSQWGWPVSPDFEPYESSGLSNGTFTEEEINTLAEAVAEKLVEKLKGTFQ